jgi:hypothetical protein
MRAGHRLFDGDEGAAGKPRTGARRLPLPVKSNIGPAAMASLAVTSTGSGSSMVARRGGRIIIIFTRRNGDVVLNYAGGAS